MVDSGNDSKGTACTNCGKEITSLSKNMSPITATTEEEYQKQKASGFGMYCPNCDQYLCLTCLPTIGAKSGKKLFGGLFSKTKPDNEMSVEDLPIDSAMKNKLEEKLKVKGTRIVVLRCLACSAYFGQFPEDKTKFVENFANKITEDYEDITIDEIATFINDLQVFISRLEKHNLLSQRSEQLRSVLELAIKQTGLPKLKQLIAQFIENKEYDEARQLFATGTQWNEYLREKGSWEDDLQSFETLMEVSKSTSGQKKIIEGGPDKIITLKAQTAKSDSEDIKLSKFKAESHLNTADSTVSHNGDLQFALKFYDRAIDIYERLVNTKEGKELENQLAKAYKNKAVALIKLGDNTASVEIFDKAIEIYERLVNTEGRKDLENDLAEVYKNKEAVASRLEGYSKEFIDQEKASGELGNKRLQSIDEGEIRAYLVKAYNAISGNAHKSEEIWQKISNQKIAELANIIVLMYAAKADSLRKIGSYQAAVELYDKAFEIWQKLSDREGTAELAENIAMTFMNKGLTLLRRDNQAAVKSFDEAIKIRERLVNFEGKAGLQAKVADGYLNKGCAVQALGDYCAALELYNQAISIWERLIKAEGQTELQADLANGYKSKANISVVLSDYKTAFESSQRGIEIYEKLINSEGKAELTGDFAWTKILKAIAQVLMQQISEARDTARETIPVLRAEVIKTGRADLKSILDVFETNFGKLLE